MSGGFFNFNKKSSKYGQQKTNKKKEMEKENNDNQSIITKSIQTDNSSSIFSKGKFTYTSSTKNSSTISSSNHSHNKKIVSQSSLPSASSSTGGNTYNDLGKPLRVVPPTNHPFPLETLKEEETSSSSLSTNINTISDKTHLQSTNSDKQNKDILPTLIQNKETISLPELYNNNNNNNNKYRNNSPFQQHLYNLETNLIELVDDIHQNVINISKAVIQAVEYFKDFAMFETNNSSYIPVNISTENNQSLRHITKIIFHFLDNLLISEGFANSRSILLKRYLQFLENLNINIFEDSNPMAKTLPYIKNFCIDDKYNLPHMDKLDSIIQEILHSDNDIISDQEGAFIAPIRRGLCPRGSILSIVFGIPNLQQEHYEMIKVLYSLFPDIHLYIIRDSIKPCAAKVDSTMTKPFTELISPQDKQDDIPEFLPPYMVADSPLNPPISMSISAMGNTKMTGTLGGYLFPQIDPTNTKLSQFAGSAFAITAAHVVLCESQDYPYVSVPSNVLQTTYIKTLLSEAQRYPKDSKEKSAFIKEAQKVERGMKWQDDNKFGQVVWGERSIVNQRLSDFAIIKVNSTYKVENCLGNKLNFVKDPTLKFQNNYVRKKFIKLHAGLNVFKIGASSNYTSGQVNGTRLVYWADGKLQTSEFVVASPLPLFATGGDSGAWILAKSEDYLGLGVVGMLHSYDGSQQQFGLFTPIGDILERLHDVTGVQWDIDPQTD